MVKFNVAALFLVGIVQLGYAQVESEAVYLTKITDVEIALQSGALKIKEHVASDKVFYKNFDKHANESVYYSDFDPILEFEAATLLPTSSTYKKTKVSTIETKDIVQPGIFYGGYKRKDFAFPSLAQGAIGRLEYTKQITDAHLLTPFYFEDDIEVRQARFTVTFPAEVKVKYKVFGEKTDNISFKEERINKDTRYTWTLNNVQPYKSEENEPSRPFSAAHVLVMVESYQYKGKTITVASDVADLYGWYGTLIKTIPAQGSDALLKELVQKLTASCTSDQEKIKIIFQWVQRNIKYIAFEDGMAGFVPRAANDVFIKRYGDCKDMANILKVMINMAGIDAYHTWIGTRSKPYSYADVPCAISDNHMICSVKLNDEYVFLDATNSFVTFGKPSSMIQGKEALIGINEKDFKVLKVPVVNYRHNQRIDTAHLELKPNGVQGSFHSVLTGYRKDDLEISELKAQIRQEREAIRDFFKLGGNNIDIDDVKLSGLGDQNVVGSADFNFFQPGYYKTSGDKMYVNMNLNKTLPGEKIDLAKRTRLWEADYGYEDHSVTFLKLPEGSKIGTLPPNVDKKWDAFGVACSYTVEGNVIRLEKKVYADFLYLPKEKFNQWNEFVQAVTAIHSQSITITK